MNTASLRPASFTSRPRERRAGDCVPILAMRAPAQFALAVFAVMCVAACAGVPAEPAQAITLSKSASGDWDDVDAAMDVGVSAAEMAIVNSSTSPDGSTRLYELRTVTDEPAWLKAQRGEDGRVSLGARVGRFGDAAREQKLVESVAARLKALYGVDWAPVPR